jgi:hypothetical protein
MNNVFQDVAPHGSITSKLSVTLSFSQSEFHVTLSLSQSEIVSLSQSQYSRRNVLHIQRVRIPYHVGFEVFTAVTMKNAVFWDVAPCGFLMDRRFGGMCHHSVPGPSELQSVCYQPSITSRRSRYFFYPEDGSDTFLRRVGL